MKKRFLFHYFLGFKDVGHKLRLKDEIAEDHGGIGSYSPHFKCNQKFLRNLNEYFNVQYVQITVVYLLYPPFLSHTVIHLDPIRPVT